MDSKVKSIVKEAIINVIVVLVIVLPIWTFVAKPFVVNGASMQPSFNTTDRHFGDYLIVELISYKFKSPKRGEIIVFKGNKSKGAESRLIKRVIGLPGEKITITKDAIFVTNDGNKIKIEEPYLDENFKANYKSQEVLLGQDEYFVLGDNRNNSFDSRFVGAIEESDIIGQVFLRLFPFNQIDIYPGNEIYDK